MPDMANYRRTLRTRMSGCVAAAGLVGLSSVAAAQGSQGPGPWGMHDWSTGWGWGMWLGPLFMIIPLALSVAAIVALARWMGSGGGDGAGRVRTARDILDERYALGEIDREEYLRRRDDMAGRS